MKVLSTTPKVAPKRGSIESLEDDCGFVFRRKASKTNANTNAVPAVQQQSPPKVKAVPVKATKAQKKTEQQSRAAASKPVVKKAETPKKATKSEEPSMAATPSKKQLLERQRRRSSLAGLSLASGRRRSSIGVGFSQDSPPANVEPECYHKHILPDLPGPLKMRQLMVWAVQRAAKEMASDTSGKTSGDWEEQVAEPLVQGLLTNELNTSWYQRPSSGASVTSRPNPVNVDMRECLGLYQKYYKQLNEELGEWRALEAQPMGVKPVVVISESMSSEGTPATLAELGRAGKWLHRLPFHVDRLGWLLHVYGNFEGHSRQYCEAVFHQIFDRFFAPAGLAKAANPLPVIKAMSNANEL